MFADMVLVEAAGTKAHRFTLFTEQCLLILTAHQHDLANYVITKDTRFGEELKACIVHSWRSVKVSILSSTAVA